MAGQTRSQEVAGRGQANRPTQQQQGSAYHDDGADAGAVPLAILPVADAAVLHAAQHTTAQQGHSVSTSIISQQWQR